MKAAREGTQRGEGQYAASKVTPPAASRARCGLRTMGWPYGAENIGPCSSLITSSTLGRDAPPASAVASGADWGADWGPESRMAIAYAGSDPGRARRAARRASVAGRSTSPAPSSTTP